MKFSAGLLLIRCALKSKLLMAGTSDSFKLNRRIVRSGEGEGELGVASCGF